MALIYIDSFDNYATADIPKRYPSSNTSYSNWSVGSGWHGNSLILTATSGGRWVGRSLGTTYTTPVTMGFVFKVGQLPTTGIASIAGFGQASQAIALPLYLCIDPVGNLIYGKYSNAAAFTAFKIAYVGLQANTWYAIAIKGCTKSSIAAHDCQIVLDGDVVIDLAAGTATDSLANIDTFFLGNKATAGAAMSPLYYDDLIVLDDTGSYNNSYIGAYYIESRLPDGAGSNTSWTPSTGSNYQNVDDSTPDGDSTYNAGSNTGDKDTYSMQDLDDPHTKTIYGIQVNYIARYTGSNSRHLTSVIRSGGTDYDHSSSNVYNLPSSYGTNCDVWEKDPNGDIDWTETTVDALEAGVKLVS